MSAMSASSTRTAPWPCPSAACGRWPTAWAAMRAAIVPASWSPRASPRCRRPRAATICCVAVQSTLAACNRELPTPRPHATACRAAPWSSCSPSTATSPACGPATAASTACARGRLDRLTRDHSLVQELIDQGELAPEAARTHPWRNRITRAVGIDERLELDGPAGAGRARRPLPAVQRRADRRAGGRGDRAPSWPRADPRPAPTGCSS